MSSPPNSVTARTIQGQSPSTQLVAGEVQEYRYDASNDLGEDQQPANATAQLFDKHTGEEVEDGAGLDTPGIEGSVIVMRVTGVERGKTYELRIAFDHDPPRVEGEHTVKLHYIQGL